LALFDLFKNLDEIKVWSRSNETKKSFIAEAERKFGHLCKFIPQDNVRKTVEGADIVVTTTPSKNPLIMDDMVSSGMHINSIGADAIGKEELDPHIFHGAKVVIDDWEQASHSNEKDVPLMLRDKIITKDEVWAEIGKIVAGLKPGRISDNEITIFTSTGIAVQDAVTAKIAYDKALQNGVGTFIKIV
jgi:alanine dehydrogenase